MMDLHTHTNFSDGTQTLEELLKKAEDQNIKYLSITDHDSIDAYMQLSKTKQNIYTGNIITGTEIFFIQDDKFNELLGYNFDVEKISRSFIFDKEERQKQELEFLDEVYPKLIEKGFKLLSKEEYIRKTLITTTFSTSECGREVLELEENKDLRNKYNIHNWRDYFVKWIDNKNSDMYIDTFKYKSDMKTVSDTIRRAGGLVFMAHIFRKPENEAKFLLEYAIKNNLIDGVEVYYRTHTKEQINYLLDFCKKHNLYISGGTDSHYQNQKLGIINEGVIPDDIVDNWINK
jgi:predicted metal-dependent phosphoesterase TrpH